MTKTFACVLALGGALWSAPLAAETVNGLRTADEFDSIADEAERSTALFNEMFVVIESPRCLNCHPVGDVPTQGDLMTPQDRKSVV